MVSKIVDHLPSWGTLFYAGLSLGIPWVVHYAYRNYTEATDPPWKKQTGQDKRSSAE